MISPARRNIWADFDRHKPANWQQLVAQLTWFFHWGPRDAFDLTWRELLWWNDRANDVMKALGKS